MARGSAPGRESRVSSACAATTGATGSSRFCGLRVQGQVLADPVPAEASPPGSLAAPFSRCRLALPPPRPGVGDAQVGDAPLPLLRSPMLSAPGPTLVTSSSDLRHALRRSVSRCSRMWFWGWRGEREHAVHSSSEVGFVFKPKCGPQKKPPPLLSSASGGTRCAPPAGRGFVSSGSLTPHGAPAERWLGDPAWDPCQPGSSSRLPRTQVLQPVCGGPGCRADCVHEQKWGAGKETGLQIRGRRVTTGPASGSLETVLEQCGRPLTSAWRSVGSEI